MATGLSRIVVPGLPKERQDKIVNQRHDFACVSQRHTCAIFTQGNIAAIVKAILNAPVGAAEFQELLGRRFLTGEAGNPKFHFTRRSVRASIADANEAGVPDDRPVPDLARRHRY